MNHCRVILLFTCVFIWMATTAPPAAAAARKKSKGPCSGSRPSEFGEISTGYPGNLNPSVTVQRALDHVCVHWLDDEDKFHSYEIHHGFSKPWLLNGNFQPVWKNDGELVVWILASPFRAPTGTEEWNKLPALAFFRNGKPIRSVLYKELVKAIPAAEPFSQVTWLKDLDFNNETLRVVTGDGGDYLFDLERGDRTVAPWLAAGKRHVERELMPLEKIFPTPHQIWFAYGGSLAKSEKGPRTEKIAAPSDKGFFMVQFSDWDRKTLEPIEATLAFNAELPKGQKEQKIAGGWSTLDGGKTWQEFTLAQPIKTVRHIIPDGEGFYLTAALPVCTQPHFWALNDCALNLKEESILITSPSAPGRTIACTQPLLCWGESNAK